METVEQNIPCSVSCAALIEYCLSSLFMQVSFVLTLQTCGKQFCVRSQESFLHNVPKGCAETGKKLIRTSAVSSQNTQQKCLKHEGDRTVGGFESRCRRMNLLTYVGTSCLFLSVCLWLLSRALNALSSAPLTFHERSEEQRKTVFPFGHNVTVHAEIWF